MKYRPLGKNLLPDQFTMNELEGYIILLSRDLIKEVQRIEMDFKKYKSLEV